MAPVFNVAPRLMGVCQAAKAAAVQASAIAIYLDFKPSLGIYYRALDSRPIITDGGGAVNAGGGTKRTGPGPAFLHNGNGGLRAAVFYFAGILRFTQTPP